MHVQPGDRVGLYYWYNPKVPNFGDMLNQWLWPQLLQGLASDTPLDHVTARDTILIGIGTLLDDRVPDLGRKIVFGSGAGYGAGLPVLDDRWTFLCVRGPLTAEALGLDRTVAITDAAILLRLLDLPEPGKRFAVSFMPHWESHCQDRWHQAAEASGIHYIDPFAPVSQVIEEIRCSECLIAEAMHGAIVADIFRVPWIPIETGTQVLPFKWQDWCASIGVPYRPWRFRHLYPLGPWGIGGRLRRLGMRWLSPHELRRCVRLAKRFLSDDKTVVELAERMAERLNRLRVMVS
jgi:succinoglycan biosynthesis protein ExoV